MKKIYSLFSVVVLVLLLLTSCLPAVAQAPAWQSARTVATATAAASNNYSQVTATSVDAAGNIYLAGHFTNTVVFGGTTLTSLGGLDVFVAKFNLASNQFVWAQRAGGSGDDQAAALAVSGTSIYVAGAFHSTADFGFTTLISTGPNGFDDVFVAKLIDAGSIGSFTWAKQAGGNGSDQATALTVSGSSVYMAGTFYSPTVGFGSATLVNSSPGFSDLFVAKLIDAGSTGSFAWVQPAGGAGSDGARALTVSGATVYLVGDFYGSTARFGTVVLTGAGASDVFVAKLTDAGSTGSFVWAQPAGGTGAEGGIALAVSGSGVYVVGSFFSSTAVFGLTTLTNASSMSTEDMFVAKLTDAGNTGSFVWAQRAGGLNPDQATALAVSGTSLYVAGYFDSVMAGFGTATLTNANTNGSADLFVAKLTDAGSTGNFVWAQRAGGIGSEIPTALAVSGANIYVNGAFDSPMAGFGSTTLVNPTPARPLGFLASLTDPTLTATTAAGPREPAAIFPNPARHTATLRLPVGTTPAPLTLTDALGRPVRHYPAPAGPEATLDLRGLPAGFYLLRGAGPTQRLAVE